MQSPPCTGLKFNNDDFDTLHGPSGFGRGGMGGLFGAQRRGFNEYFRCYSMAMMPGHERDDANFGGKIFLPPSALAKLSTLNIAYPMQFQLVNEQHKEKSSHAGVLEFTAEEGKVYLPQWMMSTLLLAEGSLVRVKNVTLPLGQFVKLQPQSVDFLDISDPKAVLERAIGNFSALTEGDIITIKYNSKLYDILIVETKPGGKGISVIETDLEVDFAPPLGYKEPERLPRKPESLHQSTTSVDEHKVEDAPKFVPFGGSGQRLKPASSSSSSVAASSSSSSSSSSSAAAGSSTANGSRSSAAPTTAGGSGGSNAPAALKLPPGKLFFGYPVVPLKKPGDADESAPNTFSGSGNTLRAARKAAGGGGTPSSTTSSSFSSSKRP
ncbi:ubiquitin fusion degradation protein 1 [Zopfochytrium polystomum]|nr:ubiquitin fusion degradation protein 1 [Zopfochytrium polystomum]